MAKFCTKCGKPTVDGKCPDCDGAVKESKVVVEEEQATSTNQASSYFSDYIEIAKNILKKPVDMVKKYGTSDKYILGIISMVVTVVLFGMYSQYLLEGLLKMMGISLTDITTALAEANMYLSAIGMSIKIDTNVGVKMAIVMAVLTALTVAIIWLMHEKVYKKKIDYKKVIAMVGVSQVPFAIGLAISFILTFVVAWLSPVVLLISCIIYFVDLHIALDVCTKLNKNQLVVTQLLAIVLPAIIMVVVAILITLIGGMIAIFMKNYAHGASRIGAGI